MKQSTHNIIGAPLIALFISLLIFCLPAQAQTPDGKTPAQETICDQLREDGVTKGLYGLCVAFCEAHDAASLSLPLDEEALQAIADSMPNGKILKNYNKRKADTDPAMPCIASPEVVGCPCFTSPEVSLAFVNSRVDDLACQVDPSTAAIFDDFTGKQVFTFIVGDNPVCFQSGVTVPSDVFMDITIDQYPVCHDIVSTQADINGCL